MIRGLFEDRFGDMLPVAWIGLVLPHRGPKYAPIEFVLDTGAAASALHPFDAVSNLEFTPADYAALSSGGRQSLVGIAGPASYYAVPARYIFGRDDGTPHVIDGEIRIAEPTSGNAGIPSILGWDILQHFRIVLDHRTGEVLLDEEPPPRRPR